MLALSTALLAACGASIEQAIAPAAVSTAFVEAQPPETPPAPVHLAVEGDGRHAYLHRVGGSDYVSLSQENAPGDVAPLKAAQRDGHAIRLLAADPAQARAMLRSLKLPASQRKLWAGEEIVLDAASYDMLQAARSKGKPLFAELRLVRLEK
ncbi:hypothetical protein GQ37_024270 [Janthinobacterium sp. BJB1]|nr:hypothetical protein CSQ90_21260 [Janthinobacterium sp. BJB303]PJC96012.1 hypothetical protein GQ37_024270 [Janthinobacterium sp. BJB1]